MSTSPLTLSVLRVVVTFHHGQVPFQLYGQEALLGKLEQGMKVTDLHFIIESRVPEAELNCFTTGARELLARSARPHKPHFIRSVRQHLRLHPSGGTQCPLRHVARIGTFSLLSRQFEDYF